jgi:tetratricopeptide (TPR) repeat protein
MSSRRLDVRTNLARGLYVARRWTRPTPVVARVVALAWLGWFVEGRGGSAWAVDADILQRVDEVSAQVDAIEPTIDVIASRSRNLEQVLGPAAGCSSGETAMARYNDAVFLHLSGDHEGAAEALFVLVTTRSMEGAKLQHDAEWYLAESLYQMQSYEIASVRYLAMLKEKAHPFRRDAVRRLLEIYARDNDPERFEAMYEAEIVKGGIEPNDFIRYNVGKTFFRRGDVARAKAQFSAINPAGEFGSRSRYFLAAIAIAPGNAKALAEAQPLFQALADDPVPHAPEVTPTLTDADRSVRDLANLAVARIRYEVGDLPGAIAAYLRVPDDSPHAAEKLYELTYSYLKQGELQRALVTSDQFLARFKEHPDSADLTLLRGNLLFKLGETTDALAAYQKVSTEFAPVRDRFRQLSKTELSGEGYVHQVMTLELGGAAGGDPSTDREVAQTAPLPAYAVAIMQEDVQLSRAIALFRELERQDTTLDTSDALLKEIGAAIGTSADVDIAEQGIRFDASAGAVDVVRRCLELLDVEGRWVEAWGGATATRALVPIRARLDGLRGQVSRLVRDVSTTSSSVSLLRTDPKVRDARMAELAARKTVLLGQRAALSANALPEERGDIERQLSEVVSQLDAMSRDVESSRKVEAASAEILRRASGIMDEFAIVTSELRELRKPSGVDTDMDPMVARFDQLHATLDNTMDRFAHVDDVLSSGSSEQLLRVREVWEREKVAVAAERSDLSERYDDADRVASGVIRSNFVRIADRFASSVLGADMGIVNVFWTDMVDVDAELKAVRTEKVKAEAELKRQHAYLEQGLDNKTRRKGAGR